MAIGYQASPGEVVRGLALEVSLSDSAIIDPSISLVSVDPAFNSFIDYAYSYPDNYQPGDGHPFALLNEAGALESSSSHFSISMGVLDQSGNQGGAPEIIDNLISFRIYDGGIGYSYVSITADILRAGDIGIVGDNIAESSFPDSIFVPIPEPTTLSLLSLGAFFAGRRRKI